MKKTIIISAMALSFSFATVNAETSKRFTNNYKVEMFVNVNPFCTSIAKGDMETVKKLIDLGTNVDEKSFGMTPVMYAAKYNRIDILKLLISKGAKLSSRSDKGKTALDYAELHKATEAANILKEALHKK